MTVSSSLRPNGSSIETVIARDPSLAGLVKQRIMGIFDCSWPLLQKLNRLSFPTIRKVLLFACVPVSVYYNLI